ncbi:MAG: RNA pseudouridine synthase, partial [Clostridia bacterium]
EGEVSAESMLAETDKSLILCHRLDTNTDGLLMFAKNDKAFNEIQNGFKNKSIAKHYRARVYGKILNDCRLTDYLVKEVKGNRVMIFAEKVKGGVEVVTDCKVTGYDGETTLVDLVIFSGKMHQIRAQLAYHKHFILGDSKYGRDDINRKLGFKKQQLTANKLTFSFPDSSYLRYLNDKNIEID